MGVRLVEDNDLIAVADAIREKSGGSDSLVFPEEFVTAIEGIQNGGSDDFEWIKDGNTHIWISLTEGRTSPMLGVCPNGTVTVDWGDGTTSDVLTGTSTSTVAWTPTHNYASAGDYIITLTVDGEMGLYGESDRSRLLCYSNTDDLRNAAYSNSIARIELGLGVTSIGSYAFRNCNSLTSIVIPESVKSIGGNAFQQCYSLTGVVIPEGVTSIGSYAFCYCYSLASVTISKSVKSIGNQAFMYCSSLTSVVIPEGVTSIGSEVFYLCHSVAFYDFSTHTSVPTLSKTSAFSSIQSDCEIRVPAALYDEWIAATNWSTYADYIVAV